MDGLVIALSAAGGLFLGDGMDLVVERLGAHESLSRPWWSCPWCKEPPSGVGFVPVLRVLQRRQPCPSCGERRPRAWRAVGMALVSALVLGAFAARIGPDILLAPYCVLGLSLVAISAVDLERYIIPNRILYPTLALMVPLLVVSAAVDHQWGSLARAAIAGAAAFVGFYIVHFIVPHGMGFGDVRLAGLLGLAMGWFGLSHAFVGFFAGFVLGAVIGIIVMKVTGGGRKTRIPFGPFLAAGAVIAVLWGNPLAHALLHRGAG